MVPTLNAQCRVCLCNTCAFLICESGALQRHCAGECSIVHSTCSRSTAHSVARRHGMEARTVRRDHPAPFSPGDGEAMARYVPCQRDAYREIGCRCQLGVPQFCTVLPSLPVGVAGYGNRVVDLFSHRTLSLPGTVWGGCPGHFLFGFYTCICPTAQRLSLWPKILALPKVL